MTLQQRLDGLYPVERLTQEQKDFLLAKGLYTEDELKVVDSRIAAGVIINKKLREAYLLGRKEKEEYDEAIQD